MPEVIAKLLGTDVELGNMLFTPGESHGYPAEAATMLLRQFDGIPHNRLLSGTSIEYGRRFLPGSGGSVYIDSDHLELNTPEHLDSRDHANHLHACLQMAREAQVAASARLRPGTRLELFANNCDGHVSYGRHTNVLTTAACFDDILHRKPHLAGFLATHLVTSVLYTGQGMVGAANDRPACDFQLSQRADWFEQFAAIGTMVHRPLLNQRDEPHASAGLARLHIIFHDTILSPIANRLIAGTTQLVVAMCEGGWADPTLQLDDPVGAASRISRDLALTERLPTTVRGKTATALELQRELALLAGEFVASGSAAGVIPDAEGIVELWLNTLDLLHGSEFDVLARRCDNWLKYMLLKRQHDRRGLSWQSPQMRLLDLRFSNLDPAEGLFFQMADAGVVEEMPTAEHITRFMTSPPSDTRAYLRAHILRRFGEDIHNMDWSWIEFRAPGLGGWYSVARIALPDPRRHTREESADLLSDSLTLNDLVSELTSDSRHLDEDKPYSALPA